MEVLDNSISCATQPISDAQEAWRRLKEHQSFVDWLKVGIALDILRTESMHEVHTNCPVGGAYNKVFSRRLAGNGLSDIDRSTRCRLFQVLEHRQEIERWLGTLEPADRMKLNHPEAVLRKWKSATAGPETGAQTRKSDTMAEQLAMRWKKASIEARRQFLDSMSFPDLLQAMSVSLRSAIQNRVIAQYTASQTIKDGADKNNISRQLVASEATANRRAA